MDSTGKIWVALDTDKSKALKIAERVAPHPAVKGFKVNRLIDQEVFRQDGEVMLFDFLFKLGKLNWVDGKFFDVPRTVAGRLKPYIDSGQVHYLTVMAKGEVDMMLEAFAAAQKAAADKVNIIAVTELTSLTEELIHLGSGHPAKASVINLARNAVLAGLGHIVCSSLELPVIAKRPELSKLVRMVPGITPAWKGNAPSDQNRIGDPAYVFKNCGGNPDLVELVIGSAICDAEDPLEAVERTAEEIEALTL